jgi:hypothetical protein
MSAELLRRAAEELHRAASHGRPVTIDAAAASALAELIDEYVEGDASEFATDDWAIVRLARAILREPS